MQMPYEFHTYMCIFSISIQGGQFEKANQGEGVHCY